MLPKIITSDHYKLILANHKTTKAVLVEVHTGIRCFLKLGILLDPRSVDILDQPASGTGFYTVFLETSLFDEYLSVLESSTTKTRTIPLRT